MADHTPGPWEAFKGIEENDKERCGVSAMRGKLGYLVATIENGAPGDFCDTEFANAKLIAAAPDLLEACQQAAKTFRGYAALHAAKNTEEADAKRAVNEVLAEQMEKAVAAATGIPA